MPLLPGLSSLGITVITCADECEKLLLLESGLPGCLQIQAGITTW